jgi:hypothetical protein
MSSGSASLEIIAYGPEAAQGSILAILRTREGEDFLGESIVVVE